MNGWYKPSRTGRTIVGLPTWMDSCRSANMSHLLEFTQAEPNSYDVLRCLNLLRYPCKDVYVNLWLYVYVSNFRFLFVYIDNFIFLATTCIYVCFAHIYIYGNTQKNEKHQFKKRTFAGGLSPIEVPGFAQGDRRLRERFVLWFHDSCIEWTKYFYSLYIYINHSINPGISIYWCVFMYTCQLYWMVYTVYVYVYHMSHM